MWDKISVAVTLAIVAEWLLRPMLTRWRKMRVSQTVAALNRGDAIRIRCAARFRNSGGGRHRAHLTVKAEGFFLSTSDGTVAKHQLGTPRTRDTVEVVAELSMLVCNVAGRQLEILLPSGEDLLLKAVLARLLRDSDENPATIAVTPEALPGPEPAHHQR
ncbi:hypothetical protein ACFVU0_13725 [Streptomyces sp. NPDC058122]|uniref:hypothetical protein n=1 Tax=Streptomyces sp. NPDC058122 TaxID=3346349 RepID=UPI0036F0D1A8